MTNPGYKFDHINRRIIITHAFHKKANVFGSVEYKALKKLRSELSDYSVEFTAPHRKTSARSHITLKQMIAFIDKQPDSERLKAELEQIRFPKDSVRPAPFAVVKKWFFTTFPNYGQMTPYDDKGHIIDTHLAVVA